jgi:uncharacterized protein (TIGR02145 family)
MGWGLNIYDLVRIPIKKICNGYYLRWWYSGWHYWFFLPGKYSIVTEGEKYYTIGTRKVTMGSGQITRGQAQGIRTIMNTREISLLTIAGWMTIRIEEGTLIIYDNQLTGVEIEFTAIIGSKEISYATGYSPVPAIPVVPPDIGYCEVIIGSQIWSCKNFDSNYPGSKVYNDDEANRLIYGGLYSYDQIMSPGFCPAGWHVPTVDEWNTLINYLGGWLVAGGKLKEAGYWYPPNTGATDAYGMAIRGAGYYAPGFGTIGELIWGMYLAASEFAGKAYYAQFSYDNANCITTLMDEDYYLSVRLIKDTSAPLTGTIYDIDGNLYHWITIGTQRWLVENLRATKYRDGAAILNIILDAAWAADTTGAYCWYNNDRISYEIPYGALYNWYAANNVHGLAPAGWRIPDNADWNKLITFLGGTPIAGGKLKEIGISHWLAPNMGATDSYGFKGLSSGYREGGGGGFIDFFTTDALFISLTSNSAFFLNYNIADGALGGSVQKNGVSIRCVQDI